MSESGDLGDPGESVGVDEHPELLAALTGISDLDAEPLEEHLDRLTQAHEVLRRALDDPPAES